MFALIFRKQIAKPERYLWESPNYNEEEDEFMKHFDENGNFIESVKEEEEEEELPQKQTPKRIIIRYRFKENKKRINVFV